MVTKTRISKEQQKAIRNVRGEKNKMKRRYYWLITASVGFGVFVFTFYVISPLFFQFQEVQVIDKYKYEVFNDLLTIVLVISGLGITVLGVAMYTLISQGLNRRVKEKVGEEMNFTTCKFFNNLSYTYWRLYEPPNYKMGDEETFDESQKRYLQIAIDQCNHALEKADLLNEEKKEYKQLISSVKNNLAYHLAMQGSGDREGVISLAKYTYDGILDYSSEKYYSRAETYAFTLIKMGDKQQKDKGVNLIERILKNKKFSTHHDYLKRKYQTSLSN